MIIGPVTFLLLSKAVDGAGAPIERLDELVPLYTDLLGQLADKGVAWVQIDEPVSRVKRQRPHHVRRAAGDDPLE